LSQANLLLELIPFCLLGHGHATYEDHIGFSHLFITIGIDSAMFTLTGLLGRWCWWWWHLLAVQKSLVLFQIMSSGMIDLTPLLCIIRATKKPLFFLI
jgi:hypothetical protein